jgi:HK97 gp10 family phage protein
VPLKVTVKTRRTGQRISPAVIARLTAGPNIVQVGFPAGEVDSDIVARAIWNEFGTRTIPERPFMRNAMRANRAKYISLMRSAARGILTAAFNGGDPAAKKLESLRKLGALAQGDIQQEIADLDTPPNAPSTIARKGSSNPLIGGDKRTGYSGGEMRQSVTWKIGEA